MADTQGIPSRYGDLPRVRLRPNQKIAGSLFQKIYKTITDYRYRDCNRVLWFEQQISMELTVFAKVANAGSKQSLTNTVGWYFFWVLIWCRTDYKLRRGRRFRVFFYDCELEVIQRLPSKNQCISVPHTHSTTIEWYTDASCCINRFCWIVSDLERWRNEFLRESQFYWITPKSWRNL